MKRILALILATLMVMTLITGCGGSEDDSSGSGSQGSSSSGQQSSSTEVDRAHTLVWGIPAVPAGLDGEFYYAHETSQMLRNCCTFMCTYAVKEDESGFLVPDFTKMVNVAAEDITYSDDNTKITIKLKEGIKTHAGNELTADDYMYKHERGEANNSNMWTFVDFSSGIYDLSQVKKIDNYTIEITVDPPNPITKKMIAHLSSYLIDSTEAKANATADDAWSNTYLASNIPGTGPYRLTSYTPGVEMTAEVFEPYFDTFGDGTLPYFKKVITREIPESSNRASMLMSGDIDIATKLTPTELVMLKDAEGVKVMDYVSNLMVFVGFDHTQEIFQNPTFKRALSYAVPYQEILDSIYLGTASQLKSVVPSIYEHYNDDAWQYSTDFETAKKLLADAGYANGATINMVIANDNPTHEQIAILLQTAFRNINVELTIEKIQTSDYFNRVANKKMGGMYIMEDSPGCPDCGLAFQLYAEKGVQNVGQYNNEEFNELYTKLMSTVDEEERHGYAMRMQEICVAEDPLWLYLAAPGFHLAMREEIMDPKWNPIQSIEWAYMYRAE